MGAPLVLEPRQLATLARAADDAAGLRNPAVVVVGEVVAERIAP